MGYLIFFCLQKMNSQQMGTHSQTKIARAPAGQVQKWFYVQPDLACDAEIHNARPLWSVSIVVIVCPIGVWLSRKRLI